MFGCAPPILSAKNKEITISCSKNRINLIHALDVSRAALLALENKAWGVYNIAAEKSPSIRELAECVVNVCDAGTVVINDESDKEKPSVRFDLDTSKAKDEFQFKQTVHLHDGLTLMYKQKEIVWPKSSDIYLNFKPSNRTRFENNLIQTVKR